MRYNHIIWDYDGTLFDSYPVMAAAFGEALKECGIAEEIAAIMAFMRISMGAATKHYAEKYQLDEAFFRRFKALRHDAEIKGTKPFPHVIALCESIRKHGGHHYLLTHRGESTAYFMEKYGLSDYFTELITAQHGFPRKPSPDAIVYLMEKHGFLPDDAMMVGDRDLDIQAGKNAGIHTCYFAAEGGALDGAEYSIASFAELCGILEIDCMP